MATVTYGNTVTLTSTTAEVVVNEANYYLLNGTTKIYYDTLANAIAGTTSGADGDALGTIYVNKDVTDTSTATINKDITLDTNGYTLTRSDSRITIAEGSTAEIAGSGTLTTTEDIVLLDNYGTLNVTHEGTISAVKEGVEESTIYNRVNRNSKQDWIGKFV